jgi:uncharacterized DUF497 family protein
LTSVAESNTTTENRWQVLGKVAKIILAIYEDKGEVKRLISAWFAEKEERRIYHGHYEEGYENWYYYS